eukprot:SAG31_NODE_509_length_14732_cov_13.043600_1_plen_725_part_00
MAAKIGKATDISSDELADMLPQRVVEGDNIVFDESYQRDISVNSAQSTTTMLVLLVCIGVLSAATAFCVDFAVKMLNNARTFVSFGDAKAAGTADSLTSYTIWILWFLALSTAATLLCKLIDDNAVGSGLPQMKSILSGFAIHKYLSLRTCVAKVLGLVVATGAGLSIGKEGPFVHISSCLAHFLVTHVSIFKPFRRDQTTYFSVLGAAVAAGVVSTFGAPVGGVLFSIEVTATYYMVGSLRAAMVAAVAGCATFKLIHQWKLDEEGGLVLDLFEPTNFANIQLDWTILAYAVLGICSGFVAGCFLRLVRMVAVFRRVNPYLKGRRFINCALIAGSSALLTFQFDILRCGTQDIVNALFSNEIFHWAHCGGPQWFGGSVFLNLLVFLLYKFVFTALAISLPIPAGVFGPVFILGAALGRFMGETLGMLFPVLASTHVAGGFAVVGAAALAGAVTRTVSTAVIVFELTTQLSHMLPVLVAVLLANAVAALLSPSIYEVMMDLNKLPYMPHLTKGRDELGTQAIDIAQDCGAFILHQRSTYRDAARLLQNSDLPHYVQVPVVKSPDDLVLIGAVQRASLQKALEEVLATSVEWVDFGVEDRLNAASRLLRSPSKDTITELLRSPSRIMPRAHVVDESDSDENENASVPRVVDVMGTQLVFDEYCRALGSESAKRVDFGSLPRLNAVRVDSAPFTILDRLPFARVHYYFTMLSLRCVPHNKCSPSPS